MSFDKTFDPLAGSPAPVATTPAHDTATAAPASGFDALGLAPALTLAVRRSGYDQPTPVQSEAIPAALAGQDLLVSSRTGSGKTAAFVLPALQGVLNARGERQGGKWRGGAQVLVLAPTRELAQQVARAAMTYGGQIPGLRIATVVGGVPYGAQLKSLRGAPDLLVATPGRLMDLMRSGAATLADVRMLVLDEADRMLDMGFIDDIRLIADALPAQRQTLMFSATFSGAVGTLARTLTREPRRIQIDGAAGARHASIEQRLYWADNPAHRHQLLEHLLADAQLDQAVVFTRTQQDADQVAERLAGIGHAVAALHGGMPQGRRNRVLTALRQGHLRVLVATDVAARGIDVPGITHVINHGLPMKEEDYVHRIGRTGRAGRQGIAVTLADRRDTGMLRRIEHFTSQSIVAAVVPGLEPRPAPRGPAGRPQDRARPARTGATRNGAARNGPARRAR